MLAPLAAAAQEREGFVLNRYRAPATLEDGFARPLPDTLGKLRFSAALTLDYAREPLVLAQGSTDLNRVGAVVSDQLSAQLAVAVGLHERVQVMALVPATLWQSGESPSLTDVSFDSPGAFAMGDPSIGAAAWILDDRTDPVGVGLELSIPLPLASTDDFASDGGFGARAVAMGSARRGPVRVSLDTGVAIRPPRDFDSVAVGPELLFGAGVYGDAARGLVVGGELVGATTLRGGQAFDRYATPLELLGGARYTHETGLTFGAGATAGLTPSPGTPSFRVLGTVGWLMPHETVPRPAPPPPRPAAPPPPPEPGDRDGDGILDPSDACPDEPEDRDQFQDEDGCPELDNDRDGIPDATDRCPMEPEDRDEFQDEDGCPDPDNDQDQILDPQDQCPNEPESMNGIQDEDGCPETVRIEGAEIRILERIEFEFNRDVIRRESFHILEEVASVIAAHPEIRLVRIEGHTDDRGSLTYNLNLSQRRADSVRRFLVEHGTDAARLEAAGFGESRPITENRTNEGRQKNRRVEFRIIAGPQAASPAPEGAVQ